MIPAKPAPIVLNGALVFGPVLTRGLGRWDVILQFVGQTLVRLNLLPGFLSAPLGECATAIVGG